MLSKNTKTNSNSGNLVVNTGGSQEADNKLYITRKRKKYKFAKFNELNNTFQFDEWSQDVFNNLKKEIRSLKQDKSKDQGRGQRKDEDLNSEKEPKVIVEIGAGTGLFSVELAKRHPENLYIAIDIKSDRLYSGAKLADELKLSNVVFIRSDIWRLKELFKENSVSEIWITFPDPYANEDQTKLNKSDAKHRLTHFRFLEIFESILKGQLHFKTDNEPLFEWSKEQFKKDGWSIIEETDDLHSSTLLDDYKIMTSYEEKFVADGLVIHLLTAKI